MLYFSWCIIFLYFYYSNVINTVLYLLCYNNRVPLLLFHTMLSCVSYWTCAGWFHVCVSVSVFAYVCSCVCIRMYTHECSVHVIPWWILGPRTYFLLCIHMLKQELKRRVCIIWLQHFCEHVLCKYWREICLTNVASSIKWRF